MVDVSIIFPFRSDGGPRDHIFKWVRERYEFQIPSAEVILGLDPGAPQFNRGAAINDGVSQSSGTVLVISDADVFVRTVNMRGALGLAARDPATAWITPFSTFYVLTKPASEIVLNGEPTQDVYVEELDWEDRLPPVPQGMFVMGREAFDSVGGFDAGFIGWGYEDNAFAHRARKKLRPFASLPGGCGHLWHPRTVNDGFNQPNIDFNRKRWEQIRCE